MFETIVALATPPLKSALAVIRLSGDDCFSIVNKVFDKDLLKNKTRGIHYGHIVDNDKVIDEVVLLTYVAPNSFTGEDSIEIMCHGSMLIANQIINLFLRSGARMAVNGEFSSRAFLNNKIDLVQAEAINDLINSTTEEAKELSMLALEGKTSSIFRPLKSHLGEMLAKIEVNIDYPEYEDIEEVSREYLLENSKYLIDEINKLINQGEKNRLYHDGLNLVIVGKPNVGKSSLLNALLKEDKAIVTNIAGTTRDIVEGEINLFGIPTKIYDTAGIHESKDVIESIGINKALSIIEKADLVIYLLDESNEDLELYNSIKDKKHIIVHNKADLVKEKNKDYVYISALNNDIDPLLNRIKEVLDIDDLAIVPSLNNQRQLGLLRKMVTDLSRAVKDLNDNQPIDLISVSLLAAYNSAIDLLGEGNKNDLSDEIFSRFCVGK